MEFVTLNTIIQDLLLIVRGSKVSQSEPISTRQLEDWIHQYRAFFLKRDLDKGKMPNPDYIQEINYLKLSPVERGGTNLITGVPATESYIYRSDLQIPETIDLNFKSGLMYVGTVAGDEILFVSEGRSKWQQYKKYTDKEPVAYLKGGYLYIENCTSLEYVTIRGVFEVPPAVGRFVNPITDQPSFTIDSKYPVPINIIPTIKEAILAKELGMEVQSPSDLKDDSASIVSSNIEQ